MSSRLLQALQARESARRVRCPDASVGTATTVALRCSTRDHVTSTDATRTVFLIATGGHREHEFLLARTAPEARRSASLQMIGVYALSVRQLV
jgi:hypothetical protein